MGKRLSRKQKKIAELYRPGEEMERIKDLVWGRYWKSEIWGDYVAYTPEGKKAYIPGRGRKAARLWAKGKEEEALKEEPEMACYLKGLEI